MTAQLLDPAGEGADAIADLWWVMFGLSLVPLAIVLAIVARIVLRRRREASAADRPSAAPSDAPRRDRRTIVLGGVVLPIVLLLPVVALTIATAGGREPTGDPDTLEIEVVGHQFWWDLTYPAPGTTRLADGPTFRTANELHVPVGRPVELVLRSDDVIHSIWIPRIDGKLDLIPGTTNRLRIQADEPGVFEGRCAEFCGEGHALMRLVVVAQEEREFQAWHEREAAPAVVEPETGVRQNFADRCGTCHDMRGVYVDEEVDDSFRGTFAPDLTHLAARRTVGAGLLPNTRESLGRWIVDPQGVKPGNRMPDVGLDGAELAELVDFLMETE